MQIGVAYSEPGQQIWLNIEVPDESTVEDAIQRSGILKQFPHIDLAAQKVGVFGRLVKLNAALKPGEPVKLFNPSMSGEFAARQRAIKYLVANKRMSAALGVGSGKTGIALGAFSELHGQGKIKKGIFAVPSIVQGQFHAEALRFLDPGKFKWHAQPGAIREERIAAYKDPSTHFSVVTHASLRDDMIHLGAKQAGIPEAEMVDKVRGMSRIEDCAFVLGALAGG